MLIFYKIKMTEYNKNIKQSKHELILERYKILLDTGKQEKSINEKVIIKYLNS
jgi:hypothetical protein